MARNLQNMNLKELEAKHEEVLKELSQVDINLFEIRKAIVRKKAPIKRGDIFHFEFGPKVKYVALLSPFFQIWPFIEIDVCRIKKDGVLCEPEKIPISIPDTINIIGGYSGPLYNPNSWQVEKVK